MLKYRYQRGELKFEELKNKMKDLFPKEEDNRDKFLTLIEVLTTNNKSYNIFAHDGANDKDNKWKEPLIDFIYDLVKDDLNFLSNYLQSKFKELKSRAEQEAKNRSSSRR